MIKQSIFTIALMFTMSIIATAQSSPVGLWKTIDDETGKAKSYVRIYEQNGKFFGKVERLLLKPADTRCDACTGDKKGQLIVGMVILENLEPYRYYWSYGTIMDPNNGKTYKASVWFEDGKPNELKVRGKHWTGLYRTQTWYRIME